MGNAAPLAGRKLVLSKTGRPVFLYDVKGTAGRTFAEKLEPLDRKHASFVSVGGQSYRLPPTWEGKTKASAEGNPAMADGKPVWRLDQVWPPQPETAANYRPMVWRDGWWVPAANSFGDQPKAEMKDRGVRLEFRAKHGDPPAERICGLVFIVPRDGVYEVKGSAELNLWDGSVPVRLTFLHKTADAAKELASLKLEKGKRVPLAGVTAAAKAGDEMVLLPRPDGAFTGGDVTLRDVEVAFAPGGPATAPKSQPGQGAEPKPAPAAEPKSGTVAPAAEAGLPPDDAYCRVDAAGHLSTGGERVRFWGAIGSFPDKRETIKGDPYFRQREAVRRVKKVGFNMIRIWHLEFDDKAKKGELSVTDVSDFFMAECGKQGVRLWAAGFGGGAIYEDQVEAAARIVDDPATAAAWVATVKGMCKKDWWTKQRKAMSLLTQAVAWDPRLEAIAIAQMREKAQHVNLHTGRRHADDPTIAVWELTNEQWWMSNMMGGQWQQLPAFFRKSLLERWTEFLRKKYGTQTALVKAWGFVFPGEDLSQGTVLLAPMAKAMKAVELNDTNPAALATFRTIAAPIGRDDCTVARGNDVIEFLLGLIISHKERWARQLKTWGKSCRLSPVLLDTGIGQSIQAQYMQMHGDAVAHASYMEGLELDKFVTTHKRWPFYSGLDTPQQMCKDVPWLEHNRPVGKPFLCYETQFGSPSKYRAEWPVRVAALGSVQDWDAACYHYWSFGQYDFTKDLPYHGALAQPGPGAYQYDYTSDELEQATMRAAGAVFRNRLVAPAPKPTLFTFGRPALLDPRSMDYAGDYGRTGLMDMMTTTYVNGMRLAIDPNQKEFLKTEGAVTRFNGFERPCPLKPSPQVEYDYQRGHVMFDAPGAAGYTGFLGQYGADTVKFANGVELRDVTHADPPATPYPSGAERFTSFTLASEDGRPLAECRRAVLVLVASSFNTGLSIKPKAGGGHDINWGREPVLVTRVGATLVAKPITGMKYRMIDFNERLLAEGTVAADGTLKIPADKPVWVTELERP